MFPQTGFQTREEAEKAAEELDDKFKMFYRWFLQVRFYDPWAVFLQKVLNLQENCIQRLSIRNLQSLQIKKEYPGMKNWAL